MSSAAQTRAALAALVEARLAEGQTADWLAAQRMDPTPASYRAIMPQVGRVMGRSALIGKFVERATAALNTPLGPMKIGDWSLADAVRILLLSEICASAPSPFKALFELYDGGDTQTRAAAVRAMNLVEDDDVEAGMALVGDAARTYLDVLLKAAWVQNPWTSKHLSDAQYRKAVLKALFCEVPVGDFIGLEDRADPELALSLCEYADEREAAGRVVPDAVWIVAAMHPRPGLVARLIGRLEHPLPDARLVAVKALGNAQDTRSTSFLNERLAREEDPAVKAAIETALGRLQEGS